MLVRIGALLLALLLVGAAIAWWRWPDDLPAPRRDEEQPAATSHAGPEVAPQAVVEPPPSAPRAARAARATFAPVGRGAATWRGTTVTAFAGAARLAQADGSELVFEVPGDATVVRFTARGYRDVVRAVDAVDGELDFGAIALEADASVRVRVRGTGALAAEPPFASVVDADGVELARGTVDGACDLPVPSSQLLTARVRLGDSLELPPQPFLATSGERHELTFTGDGDVATLQLDGISRSLLPHLRIALTPVGGEPGAAIATGFDVATDADGRARVLLPAGRWRAAVATATRSIDLLTADGSLDLARSPAAQRLSPREPVLALVAMDHGATVASAIAGLGDDLRVWHVVPRADAPRPPLRVRTTERGPGEVDAAALREQDDVQYVAIDGARPFGTLLVTVRATPQPAALLDLVAEPLAGGTAVALPRKVRTCRADLAAGSYRLRWHLRGAEGPVAAEHVVVAAGVATELTLDALPLARWRATCAGLDLEHDVPHTFLELGGVRSLGAAQQGVFTIDLATSPVPGTAGAIVLPALAARFPAEVTAIDAGAGSLTLRSNFAEARWVTVAPPARAGGAVCVALLDETSQTWTTAVDAPLRVPVAAGQPRRGCAIEQGAHRDVLCWLALDGTSTSLTANDGHLATVHFARQTAAHRILLAGPGDLPPIAVREAAAEQDHALWIPAGTRAVLVESAAGTRTFAADGAAITVD